MLLIEVSCLAITNVADKESKKAEKYQQLAGEMLRTYNQMIPVVFGVSGIVSNNKEAI